MIHFLRLQPSMGMVGSCPHENVHVLLASSAVANDSLHMRSVVILNRVCVCYSLPPSEANDEPSVDCDGS